jgi:nicotinate-nucleotide pyrophosphorylase (carboxylating)
MLDNFSASDIDAVLAQKVKGSIIELSGGIDEQNIDAYLKKGVDAISVGSLTYGINAVDISMKIEKL